MALYVYGLMRAEDGSRALEQLTNTSIELVEHEGVCALVRNVDAHDLTLRRDSALAHTETLQSAFQHGPVLPVRFGTVLSDADSLKDQLLAPRSAALRGRLEALEGLAEMQLKASYLEQPLLRSILGSDRRLAATAARIQNLPPEATHFDRLGLGEAIHRQVESRRQSDSDRLLSELHPFSVAVSVREPAHERAVLNASFLVPRDRLEDFDAKVEQLSEEAADKIQFRLIGPMPAHSFAEGNWTNGVTAESGTWD